MYLTVPIGRETDFIVTYWLGVEHTNTHSCTCVCMRACMYV